MSRLLLLLLLVPAWQPALAQIQGRVLAYPNPAEYPDAPPVIDPKIVQALAIPNEFGSLELYMLPAMVAAEDVGRALLPIQFFEQRLDSLDQTYLKATVRPGRASASVSVWRGSHFGPYLGVGFLAGGRVEDGRLRGRMVVVSSFKVRSLIDVPVDAPIINPATAQALPDDGGAPWQALLGLRAALTAGSEAGIRAALVPSLARELPIGDAFRAELTTLREKFPVDSPLVQGWLTDIDARLVLLDESEAEPVRVVVDMARNEAGWRLQDLSYRHPGVAVEPPDLESFAHRAGADERPLEPGIAISTELALGGHSLRPRHAIGLAVPDQENEHWILLSEAPLPTEHLGLLFSGGSLEPLFSDGKIQSVLIKTKTAADGNQSIHVGLTGILRQGSGGEAVFDLAGLGISGIALIDGVIYGHFENDAHQLRFAARVHSIREAR